MSAPQKILQLVERFDRNLEFYKRQGAKEEDIRYEYINPFFKELGWDVDNEKGLAFNYKEVIPEDSIKVSGVTKAPDYAFRVGNERKFFLEAKHPHINIEQDKNAIYQLRRYAWSQKLPLSILTDFEDFAVYDCRFKPNQTDSASLGRIMLINFRQYPDKWDEIASVFSRDAVWKGSFDKFAEETKGKKGTTTVDDEFLNEIETWRRWLASNIAIRNYKLTNRELNSVVQNTIDRIIFLRICEDRDIEEYGQLQMMLNGNNVYRRLIEIYKKAEQKYNSGLFHFYEEKERKDQDKISLDLNIDDKPLKDIIKRLYYPESPYEFSVIPVEILGNVYEKFLGKVIRLTLGHQARIQDKPEYSKSERKAKGVYYTPKYIVDYIVKNTVGKLLENKTIEEASEIRILDPACGSGSFLLGAYRNLLDWHLKKYIENYGKYTKIKNPPIYQYKSEEYKLTIKEKKRILLNNIYGVDIDEQAVEVTKLSLLLKTLEGETGTSITNQLQVFHDKALPDLSNNIKCGNSLIGNEIYNDEQQTIFNEDEKNDINAFDWESKKGFYDIMKNGGFDVVIGNPPYGAYFNDKEKFYLKNKFKSSDIEIDSYILFIENSLKILNKHGNFSMIVPNNLLTNMRFEAIRKNILDKTLYLIVDLGSNVFKEASVDTCLIFTNNLKSDEKNIIKTYVGSLNKFDINYKEVNQDLFMKTPNHIFNIMSSNIDKMIENKILESKQLPLISFVSFARGIEYGYNSEYIITKSTGKNTKPIIAGRCITRYNLIFENKYVIYNGDDISHFKSKVIYENEKILMRRIGLTIIATIDSDKYYNVCDVYNLLPKDQTNLKYILGIINSTLMSYFLKSRFRNAKKLFPKIPINYLEQLPILNLDFNSKYEKQKQYKLIQIVEQMLELNKKVRTLQGHEKTVVERQIEATDRQIDKLVYELYGLTDNEIKVVEGDGK